MGTCVALRGLSIDVLRIRGASLLHALLDREVSFGSQRRPLPGIVASLKNRLRVSKLLVGPYPHVSSWLPLAFPIQLQT